MNGKRILPWEAKDFDRGYQVDTQIVSYTVLPHAQWFVAWASVGVSRDRLGSFFDNADAAMDACEADYLARCTEFLRLAGPGECVVSVKHLRVVANTRSQSKRCSCEECTAIRELITEMESQTAAIDAAKGEWK